MNILVHKVENVFMFKQDAGIKEFLQIKLS